MNKKKRLIPRWRCKCGLMGISMLLSAVLWSLYCVNWLIIVVVGSAILWSKCNFSMTYLFIVLILNELYIFFNFNSQQIYFYLFSARREARVNLKTYIAFAKTFLSFRRIFESLRVELSFFCLSRKGVKPIIIALPNVCASVSRGTL